MIAWKEWPRSTRAWAIAVVSGAAVCVFAIIPLPLALIIGMSSAPAHEIKAPLIVKLPEPSELKSYAGISERPLFNADRKPDPLPPPPPPPTPPKPQVVLGDLTQLKLVGVVLSGDNKLALVRRASAAILTLRVGDTLDGWKVDKIDAQGVGLSGGEHQDGLRIPKAENKAAALPNVRAERE